jgi:hypothetical protein
VLVVDRCTELMVDVANEAHDLTVRRQRIDLSAITHPLRLCTRARAQARGMKLDIQIAASGSGRRAAAVRSPR